MAAKFYSSPLPTAIALGIIVHNLLFKYIELDIYLPHLFVTSILTGSALTYAHIHFENVSVVESILKVSAETICFTVGVFFSMVVYRLFFHRLRHFPGPFWARASRFYAMRLAAKNVQYHVELEKLHEQYGDFIRTGPRELCIIRKSAVPLINIKCLKSTYYNSGTRKPTCAQLALCRNIELHNRRKRAWEKAFTVKSLAVYQPRIKDRVDQLVAELQSTAGEPKDVTAWMMMLAFDIMGEIGYSKSFDCITTGKEHPAATAIHDHMKIFAIGSMVPWLLNIAGYIPGALAGYKPFFEWCGTMIKEKKSTYSLDKYPQDISSWIIKAVIEKDPSASPTEESLHDDGRLMIVAGSDTSATANACTLYYLASHPHTLHKLQSALDAVMPNGALDWTYEKAKSVSYLDDVINECMRLKPPVITGGYRVTPPEGLQVDEVWIPGDVNVITPIEMIQTDERYWERAKEFVPERWGEKKVEMGTDESLLVPFSGGTYKCTGYNLAMMGMRITISSIVQQFNVTFAPGETGEMFDTGRKDVFTTVLPPLQLVFTPRK